jgi:hypothetical protein
MKEDDMKFIYSFSHISVKNVCIDLGYGKSYANIIAGKASSKKIHKVRKEIEKRLSNIKTTNIEE